MFFYPALIKRGRFINSDIIVFTSPKGTVNSTNKETSNNPPWFVIVIVVVVVVVVVMVMVMVMVTYSYFTQNPDLIITFLSIRKEVQLFLSSFMKKKEHDQNTQIADLCDFRIHINLHLEKYFSHTKSDSHNILGNEWY